MKTGNIRGNYPHRRFFPPRGKLGTGYFAVGGGGYIDGRFSHQGNLTGIGGGGLCHDSGTYINIVKHQNLTLALNNTDYEKP